MNDSDTTYDLLCNYSDRMYLRGKRDYDGLCSDVQSFMRGLGLDPDTLRERGMFNPL